MAFFNARTIIFLHPTALHSPTLTPSSSLSQYARFALSDTTLACSQSLRPYKNQHRHCYLKTTERPSTKRRRHASPRRTCKPSQVRAKSSKREPVRIAKPSSVQDQHRHPYLYSAGRSSTKRRRHQSTPYLQALQSESIVFPRESVQSHLRSGLLASTKYSFGHQREESAFVSLSLPSIEHAIASQ